MTYSTVPENTSTNPPAPRVRDINIHGDDFASSIATEVADEVELAAGKLPDLDPEAVAKIVEDLRENLENMIAAAIDTAIDAARSDLFELEDEMLEDA